LTVPGRDNTSGRVDELSRYGPFEIADGRDAAVTNPNVGGDERPARAIGDASAADDDVVGLGGRLARRKKSKKGDEGRKKKRASHNAPLCELVATLPQIIAAHNPF